jgi:hypothetical protein
MPLAKGMPAISARDYIRKVDRAPEDAAQEPNPPRAHDEHEPPPLTDDDIPF